MYVQNAPGVAQSAQEARVLSTGRGIHLKPGPPRILVIYRCIYTHQNRGYSYRQTYIYIYIERWAKGCDMEFSRSSKFFSRFFHHKFKIPCIRHDFFSIHINLFMRIQWNGSQYFIFGYL